MNTCILHREAVEAMHPLLERIAADLATASAHVKEIMARDMDEDFVLAMAEALDATQALVTEFERLGGCVRSYDPVQAFTPGA